ncbi:hypothetical protein GCM10028857_29840 [Salinarchaeum chitinilyticum]
MAVAPGHADDGPDREVIGSLDDAEDQAAYVIADIATEEAWVSIDAEAAPALEEMR